MSAAVSLPPTEADDVRVVRAYADACCDLARASRDDLEASIDRLVASRQQAEVLLERCRRACDLAERMCVFAARAMSRDVDLPDLARAAAAIRELVRDAPAMQDRRSSRAVNSNARRTK